MGLLRFLRWKNEEARLVMWSPRLESVWKSDMSADSRQCAELDSDHCDVNPSLGARLGGFVISHERCIGGIIPPCWAMKASMGFKK